MSDEFIREYESLTGKTIDNDKLDISFRTDDVTIQLYKTHTKEWCSDDDDITTIFVHRIFKDYIEIICNCITVGGEYVKINHANAYADLLHKFMGGEITKEQLDETYNAYYEAEHQIYDRWRF